MVVQVRLFGALKRFGEAGIIQLAAELPMPVHKFKQELQRYLIAQPSGEQGSAIVARSACSDGSRILGEMDELPVGVEISVLPPVCGG